MCPQTSLCGKDWACWAPTSSRHHLAVTSERYQRFASHAVEPQRLAALRWWRQVPEDCRTRKRCCCCRCCGRGGSAAGRSCDAGVCWRWRLSGGNDPSGVVAVAALGGCAVAAAVVCAASLPCWLSCKRQWHTAVSAPYELPTSAVTCIPGDGMWLRVGEQLIPTVLAGYVKEDWEELVAYHCCSSKTSAYHSCSGKSIFLHNEYVSKNC